MDFTQKHFYPICGTPIWNTQSVYTSGVDFTKSHSVDFTFCFEYTILKWCPCFVLWVVAPFWIYMLTRDFEHKLRFSLVSFLKFVVTFLLTLIEFYNLYIAFVDDRYLVYYMTPLILIATYALVFFFNHYERLRGLRSSSLLFAFWGLLVLCSTITFRSNLLSHYYFKNHTRLSEIYMFYVFFVLITCNLVLSTFSEKFSKAYEYEISGTNKTPENVTPLLSKLSFLWIDPLIHKGFRRDLTREDIWDIENSETSSHVTTKLEKEWKKHVLKYENLKMEPSSRKKSNASARYKTNLDNNEEELILNGNFGETDCKSKKSTKEPSLLLILIKVFGGKFFAGTFLKLLTDVLSFSGPIILDLIINFIKDKEQNMIVGLFLTILLFITSFSQSLILQHYYFRMYLVGARVRTALVNMIYKKSLRLSTTSRKVATVGEMTNLISVNAQLFLTLIQFLNMLWSSPLQIIICIYMLWRYLGIAAFAGLATTIIFIPLNVFATDLNKKFSVKKLNNQDLRIKVLNEILAGIKVIKFYGWELSFQRIVNKIRNDEMKFFSRNALVGVVSSFTWASAPFLVATVSYSTFVLINDKNNLDPSTAFVSLTLFYLIRFPLALLPQTISLCVQGYISLKRIKNFLLLDETNDNDIQHENIPDVAISLKNVNMGWNKTDPFLYNLNFEVKTGKLMAIVGTVGSGKSSLISATLGEMHKLNDGKININGTIAYVPQQAWIQNATIRDNILFGREYNQKFYNKIVSACSLLPDFTIMPSGDCTEIGEKGINLSGGQKQRISLARSLYSDADIYVLDDPLSAVDAHVGKLLFDLVIGPNGMLKNKTRLFVTNSLSFLPQVDEILMIDNGTIAEMGSYEDLKNKDGLFSNFIKLFLAQNKENTKDNEEHDMILTSATAQNSSNDFLNKSLNLSKRSSASISPVTLQKQDSLKSHFDSDSNLIMKTSTRNNNSNGKNNKIIDKENIESGTIKMSVLIDYVKKCGIVNSLLFILFFILSTISLAASSLWLSAWSNEANKEQSQQSKYFYLLIYVILGLAQCILLNVSNIFLVLMYIRAAKLFHIKLLSSILRSTLHFFESTPTGRIINRFSRDIESIETLIPDSFKIFMFCLYNIIHTFIILGYSTPFSLILIGPISVVYIFIQRYYVSSSRQLARLDSSTKSPIFSYFSESLNGVSTIRAYGVQKTFIRQMEKNIDENTVYIYTNNCAERWLIIRLDLIATLIAALASLFAVFSRNSLSPGLVGLSISLSITVSQALNFFVKMGAEFEANITGVERIREYFQIPQEAEWSSKDSKIPVSWPNEGKIVFANYSCQYRKDLDFVLKDINAEILPGEKIGIVGRTGAGKSSLSLGLFRLIEYNVGDIIIDNINIEKIGLHDLRHKLTIIPQEPVIFSGTIRMNLDPFSKYSDDELWHALELAYLKDFIMEQDEKLDFKCTEGGDNLSVGQRQLICLARALLRKTKILILDEATASVDHNTDELIQKTIRTQFKDCTVLTIAHRLNTIMDSSRIMVLDKGKIVEFDTPEALLQNKSGFFYSMAKDAEIVS